MLGSYRCSVSYYSQTVEITAKSSQTFKKVCLINVAVSWSLSILQSSLQKARYVWLMVQLLCKKDGSLTNVGQNLLVAWSPVAQAKSEIEFKAIFDTQERSDGGESKVEVDDDDDDDKDGDEADDAYDDNDDNFNQVGWRWWSCKPKIKMTTTTTTMRIMMMMMMKMRGGWMWLWWWKVKPLFFSFAQDSQRYWSSRELWNSSTKNNICWGFRWRGLR